MLETTEVEKLLASNSLGPSRSLGQNFVSDPFVIEQMVRKLAAAKAREQRDADEEGCGALLCAIRLARRHVIKDLARGAG